MKRWLLVLIAGLAACTSAEPRSVSSLASVPETSVPETSVPESSVPESSVPETVAETSPGSSVLPTATPDGWQAIPLPESFTGFGKEMIWTGAELVFIGGQDATSQNRPSGDPGFAYNPDTGRWRQLQSSPLEARYGAAAVWTGSTIIITGGEFSSSTASYSPESDSWAVLADSPLSTTFVEAVWTPTHLVATGSDGMALYEPSSDTWRLADAPPQSLGQQRAVVWTGSEVIVWPGNVERRTQPGLAFNIGTNTWRILPEPPMWPAAPSMVWTGQHILLWGGLPAAGEGSERAVGSQFDPETNLWRAIPEFLPEPAGCECNLGSQSLLWTGARLLVFPGDFASGLSRTQPPLLGYEPDTRTWELIGDAPPAWGAPAVMAAEQVVVLADRLYISNPDWKQSGETITLLAEKEAGLNSDYEECAVALGLDPGGVQVLLNALGQPWWVKTGNAVPADIHEPCFELIGGVPATNSSSWD